MSVVETSSQVKTTLRTDHVGALTVTPEPRRPVQKAFAVTLTGRHLLAIAITTAILIHQQTLDVARAILLFVPFALFVYHDYRNFLRLGPGGIPSTPRGYLKVTWLSLFALKNKLEPPPTEPYPPSSSGLLAGKPLPKRLGARPTTAGIAPQRQVTQYGSTQCFQALRKALQSFAAANPTDFETNTSRLEKHGLALFAKNTVRPRRAFGEICHVHDSDHSLHLFLHPDDIREVLEKGWGERHPMAWEWGYWKPVVGPFFLMVYAPRDEHELRVVAKIIEASAWNLSGKEIQLSPHLPAL